MIYLVRHGETDWNASGRWQGQADVPLNPNGRAQALALGAALRETDVRAIASSDLARASETARIVAEGLGLGVDHFDAGLRERSLGVFDGLTRDECATLHPQAWQDWLEHRRPPTGAEADRDLAVRVTAAIGRVVGRLGDGGAPVLVVSHGGAIRAAVAAALGVTPPPIPNCGVWSIEWDGGYEGTHGGSIVRGFALPLPVRPRTC